MFNVGGGELLVIALIALIVLGPQRLPGAARQAGKVLADLRRLSTGFQNEMRDALAESDQRAITPRADPAADRTADASVDAAISAVSQPEARDHETSQGPPRGEADPSPKDSSPSGEGA